MCVSLFPLLLTGVCIWSNGGLQQNALEVAVKVKLLKKNNVGLHNDYQVAMLANLSSFFKV